MKTSKSKTPWPTHKVMEQIYEQNLWGTNGAPFYSGEGSHSDSFVAPYIQAVVAFLQSFDEKLSVCDLGCGDFNIGSQIYLHTSTYIGVDIVSSLITHLRTTYQDPKLTFLQLNISESELPKADCVLLRQVLQHLSNREIQQILDRLKHYRYLILTEHIPNLNFDPNIDILSGQGIRLKKKSGVRITAAPFYFPAVSSKEILSIPLNDQKERIVTTLYEL